MKTKVLFLSVLIICLSGLCFAGDLKKAPSAEISERMTKNAERLVGTAKYEAKDLAEIDLLSLYGYHNLVFDICDRVRKLSVDENLLKVVKVHQNVALVRIWVENGLITSINQIPIETMGAYNFKPSLIDYYVASEEENEREIKAVTEALKKSLYEALTDPDSAIIDVPDGVTMDNYEAFVDEEIKNNTEDLKREFRGSLPPEYSPDNYTIEKRADFNAEDLAVNYARLLAQVCTIELIEKYPLNAERLYNDYMTKYGIDNMTEIMINYFISAKKFEKAIGLCDLTIELIDNIDESYKSKADLKNKEKYEILKAVCYAKMGRIEDALGIANKIYGEIDSEDWFQDYEKINNYFSEILLYKYAGAGDLYKDDIERIKNEILILSKDPESLISYDYDGLTKEEIDNHYTAENRETSWHKRLIYSIAQPTNIESVRITIARTVYYNY